MRCDGPKMSNRFEGQRSSAASIGRAVLALSRSEPECTSEAPRTPENGPWLRWKRSRF
jgi:hypothetical protein